MPSFYFVHDNKEIQSIQFNSNFMDMIIDEYLIRNDHLHYITASISKGI